MSEILGAGPENMVSLIHLDGPNRTPHDALLRGWQPAAHAGQRFARWQDDQFTFFDGTNIAPDAGHMQRMVLTVLDNNHHTEDWTFAAQGKEMKEFFDLRRKL